MSEKFVVSTGVHHTPPFASINEAVEWAFVLVQYEDEWSHPGGERWDLHGDPTLRRDGALVWAGREGEASQLFAKIYRVGGVDPFPEFQIGQERLPEQSPRASDPAAA